MSTATLYRVTGRRADGSEQTWVRAVPEPVDGWDLVSVEPYEYLYELPERAAAVTRPEMTARRAYRKGWDASARSRRSDLDDGEARFVARWGRRWVDGFTAGWVDYAAGRAFGHSLDTVEPEED